MKNFIVIISLFVINLPVVYSQQEMKECYNWIDVDTYPIYKDTIPFLEHILNGWRYPYPDGSFVGRLVVDFSIDTTGQITNIGFRGGIADCRPCVKNTLEILHSAKPFIPATKDNKPVCLSIFLFIPYDRSINHFKTPFYWYLSPEDSSIVDAQYMDLGLTDFLRKEPDSKSCTPLDMLDELPVYKDTISFEDHIKRLRKPLSNDYHYRGRYVVSMEIDTIGNISNIRILDDNVNCDKCLENVYEILQTAKPFIPGKKDGKAVRTATVFAIPYNERIRQFLNPLYLYINSQGSVVENTVVRMHQKMNLLNKR